MCFIIKASTERDFENFETNGLEADLFWVSKAIRTTILPDFKKLFHGRIILENFRIFSTRFLTLSRILPKKKTLYRWSQGISCFKIFLP